jgi:uncharacterized protein YbbK (DUF523 family)
MKFLVSACLIGFNTIYDGRNNLNDSVVEILKKYDIPFYPLCTEQLGGLPTPRACSEIEEGYTSKDVIEGRARIKTIDGEDVTEQYLKGAREIVQFCKTFDITHALLQERSPACGFTKVYDGTFSGKLIDGVGILTQMLLDNDIKIVHPDNLEQYLEKYS